MSAGGLKLTASDVDLIIDLLAEQRALKIKAREIATPEIARKFDVGHQVIYSLKNEHIQEVEKRARQCLKLQSSF